MGDENEDVQAGSDAALAAEVTQWLDENWDPELLVDDWWKICADSGWTAPHFTPEQGGKGLERRSEGVVRGAFKAYGALLPPGGLGLLMAAPTILTQGTPEQIERHVTPVLEGRLAWAQLFSEPGAGSDLAGLTTRAERDGDRWIINGQKVWSSMAMEANWAMLIARTDFDVQKHAGLSWFAFNLEQPGVTIRPLVEMTGQAVFNEIFIDDAVALDADLIGGEGNGWMVTQTTLHFERTGIGSGGGHSMYPLGGEKNGFYGHGRKAGEAATQEKTTKKLVLTYDDVIALARKRGATDDPHIRQDLARLYSFSATGRWNAERGKAEAARGGGAHVASTGKIGQTRIVKLAAEISMSVLGPEGQLADADGEGDGVYAEAMVFSAASSIYGGTDQIQRNIIAERNLGLPREPDPNKGKPYREVLQQRAES